MIGVSYDPRDGVVHTVTRGTTSRGEIEAYILELFTIIEQVRGRWGRYWHLVDASRLDIQSDENLKCLAGASIEFQHPEDRTAVIMTSFPAIRQIDRMPSQLRSRVFPDEASAREWLHSGSEVSLSLAS